jgi:hypothetical protein
MNTAQDVKMFPIEDDPTGSGLFGAKLRASGHHDWPRRFDESIMHDTYR